VHWGADPSQEWSTRPDHNPRPPLGHPAPPVPVPFPSPSRRRPVDDHSLTRPPPPPLPRLPLPFPSRSRPRRRSFVSHQPLGSTQLEAVFRALMPRSTASHTAGCPPQPPSRRALGPGARSRPVGAASGNRPSGHPCPGRVESNAGFLGIARGRPSGGPASSPDLRESRLCFSRDRTGGLCLVTELANISACPPI